MKTLALLAATGSLAAIAAPASAADMSGVPLGFTDNADLFAPAIAPHTVRYDDDWDDRRWRDRGRWDDDRRWRDERRPRGRDRVWRGRDGRYYCEREDGTTGLIVGAVGGALLGRVIDRHGDRTVGTLLGGALGAVLGREIDRSELSCR